jgi:glycosyltransferase involved in cell wall biosynthesis
MNKVPHTEMHELYNDMDLFIVASLEDGTPNGALEAMASGIPVISNRIGNMPEIIQNGYNGYLIDGPTKIENYVKLIKNLDKEHLIEMGKNARQSILNG